MIKFFEDALPQRSPEWFEWRSKRGMASEAACVMGESSYEPTTWLQLYNLKLDDRHQAPLTTPAMQWGIDHEPDARDWFVARHGIEILPCVVADEFRSQWTDGAETIVSEFQLGASLDGESGDGTPVEIKCPFKGIDSDLAEVATRELDDHDSAYRAGLKHSRRLQRDDFATFRRRLWGFLRRRGFDYSVSKQVIGRLWNERQRCDGTVPEAVGDR